MSMHAFVGIYVYTSRIRYLGNINDYILEIGRHNPNDAWQAYTIIRKSIYDLDLFIGTYEEAINCRAMVGYIVAWWYTALPSTDIYIRTSKST